MTYTQIRRPLLNITWDVLPDDFILPDDPVDNNLQPLLAAALRESLELAGLILEAHIVATNFGICATVEGETIVKAPDWVWIRETLPIPKGKIRRSYSPHAEGAGPTIVMEFISHTNGGEYDLSPHYPYGKWHFYEQILQVPIYVIFLPATAPEKSGVLELYRLETGGYQQQMADANNRYWLEELGLYLGVWQGEKVEMTANWLRWWDSSGNLLPWGIELVEQAAQMTAEIEQERKVTQLLTAKLRELGIDPTQLS